LKDNEVLKDLEQNESIDRLIPKILSREQFKAKQEAKPNIQILEFYADIDKKKTVMHYYHIPRHVLIYFQNDEINRMHLIRDRSLRDPFLQLVMENIDPIETIWSYLQKAVRGKALARTAMYALQERWKILCLKEGKRMKHNSIIKEMYDEGVKVRNGLGKMSELRQSQTDYASSGGKRAAGVAYRLLNAAKADNKNQFLDTVIRLYLQVGVPVPAFLLQVLEEKRADFPTLAGAFITGLLSADSSENPEKSSLEEETTTSNND
jgi:CRISPR-associated protein Cst1